MLTRCGSGCALRFATAARLPGIPGEVPVAHVAYFVESDSQPMPTRSARAFHAHNMSVDAHANRPVARALFDERDFQRQRCARFDLLRINKIRTARADIVNVQRWRFAGRLSRDPANAERKFQPRADVRATLEDTPNGSFRNYSSSGLGLVSNAHTSP